jgi:DNA-binding beta-propeller fold protein YncE
VTVVLLSILSVSAQAPLVPAGTIELSGVEGRIDHLAFDASTQRLYVAALGNGTVEVIDTKAIRVLKSLPGFREPQGIAVVPALHVVAVAEGEGGSVRLIGEDGMAPAKVVRVGNDPDNLRYDERAKRLYVGYGEGALSAIDATNGSTVGDVKLGGHPESFQLERSGPRIFVNVPDASRIAVVDRTTMKVLAAWPVRDARSNFPMALDETNHQLLVACRQPARVLLYDTRSGKQSGSLDTVGDADDLFYDSTRRRLYVSGGEGFVDVFQRQATGNFSHTTRVPTAQGARTSLFVPEQNKLYVAVPHRGTQKAEILIFDVS